MKVKELKTIEVTDEAAVAVGSTIGSLIGYQIGKQKGDGVPPMLIGGMLGTIAVMILLRNV